MLGPVLIGWLTLGCGSPTPPAFDDAAVALVQGTEPGSFCSGVVIADDWVLTASHCVAEGDVQAIEVAGRTFAPAEVVSYSPGVVDGGDLPAVDLALVRVDAAIGVASLGVAEPPGSGNGMVVGFGGASSPTAGPESADAKVVPPGSCRVFMTESETTPPYCLEGTAGFVGGGDSGGPFVVVDDGRWVVAAVGSQGDRVLAVARFTPLGPAAVEWIAGVTKS